MNLNAHVFTERLKLDHRETKQVINCPFHVDTGASFSVDLDKAVFYCFGGCADPKGGGAIVFLQKWATVRDGKTLTRDAARRELRSVRKIPSAAELRRSIMREEVELFVEASAPFFADQSRRLRRAIDDINWLHARESIGEDETWEHLAILHRELQWLDGALDACVTIKPETFDTLTECKRRNWWTAEIAIAAREHRAWKAKQRTLLHHLWTVRDAIDENLHEPGLLQKLMRRASETQKIVLTALRLRFAALYDEWAFVGLSQRQKEELRRCLDDVRCPETSRVPRTPIPMRTPVPR